MKEYMWILIAQALFDVGFIILYWRRSDDIENLKSRLYAWEHSTVWTLAVTYKSQKVAETDLTEIRKNLKEVQSMLTEISEYARTGQSPSEESSEAGDRQSDS